MTTLRSSSFLRLFVLPFLLSFWVSACSSSGWKPIEASPLTADDVSHVDSLRVITADSQQVVLYPEITVFPDTLVGRIGVEVKRRGRTIVELTRTAIPLDSIQSVESIPEEPEPLAWDVDTPVEVGTVVVLSVLGVIALYGMISYISEY